MLKKVDDNENLIIEDNVIKYESMTFYLVRNTAGTQIEQMMIYDALVIEGGDPYFTRTMVHKIRGHFNPEFYLKPLFLLHGSENKDPMINSLIDGVLFSLEQIKFVSDKVNQIFLKTNELYFPKSISFEAQVINKMINMLYTREKKEIRAFPYFHSGIGYCFPEASVNFSPNDEHQVLDIMDIAVKEGMFTQEFDQRTYLCSNCSSGYLSYREVCPRCGSSNSDTEDLIHHFACGYVGPIGDFTNEIDDELNCPKCNKTLRHIGVDYDKPSVLHTCYECNHRYQDFHVKAKCLQCAVDNSVEKLVPRTINSYTLTKKGESVALNGYISTTKDFDEIIGTVKVDVFKIMVRYEVERLRQTEYRSNIAYLHLRNAGELYSRIGSASQKKLLTDLIGILRSNLRSSDFITFYNSSTLLVSLNDIPHRVAVKIMNEVKVIVERLLRSSFKDVDIDIKVKVNELVIKLSHELQIQQLTKDLH